MAWLERRGIVEASNRDRERAEARIAESERRAAIAAEAALGDLRRVEDRRPAARPLDLADARAGEGAEIAACRFLAHPAEADRNLVRRRLQTVAYSAALAAAAQDGRHGSPPSLTTGAHS